MALQHLRSSTANKRPTPGAMSDGQLALNTNLASPGLFFKDSNGDSVKIGPIHCGATAPNASPGAGGQAGNSLGEAWLDTSAANPILKVFNGSAFVAVQPVGTGTVVSTTDTGTVTSTMILDGTILNADINASAAIAGTKISPDFGSQTIATTGIVSHALGSQGAPTVTFTGDTNTGIFSPGADQLAISTNGTGRLFVDATGNVGVGVTPVDVAGFNSIQIGDTNGAFFDCFTGATHEARILSLPGDLRINQITSGSLGLYTNNQERARIDSSGRLLVGTSSVITNGWGGTSGLLQVAKNDYLPVGFFSYSSTTGDAYCPYLELHRARGTQASPSVVSNNDELGEINFYGYDGSTFIRGASIRSYVDGTPGANDMPGRLVFSTTADGASSPTERWRITSGGAFYSDSSSILIGTGGAQMSGGGRIIIRGDFFNGTAGQELTTTDNSNGAIYMQFGNSVGTRIGSITRASSTSIAFNSTSDYRLKENIAKVDQASQKIQQLRPVTFNFIGHADELSTGFIAHELQEIIPEAVSGAKDAVYADGTPNYQGIDQSKLVPLLTAALQEAIGEIESLKARVTALESA